MSTLDHVRGRIQAVIFDLDGTLVQSEDHHRESWVQPLGDLGFSLDSERYYRDFAGRPGMQIIRDQIGISGDAAAALYDRVNDRYWEIVVDGIEPTAGLIAFLESIAEVPMAVCTSAQRESAHRMLTMLGLVDRFGAIVTATDVTHGKPAPEPFLLAAERLEVEPRLCVAFEDSANGLRSARAAGMYCVGIGAGVAQFPELADYWVTDFVDFDLNELSTY